ncbi:MAG: threonine ammonia-lyase [Bdellovibrionaceae bacterium]|nr:threonine ammonia-lyase [Pseudobdellovibrionaceae bacterium]
MSLKHPICFDDIVAARERISKAVFKTQLELSESASKWIGKKIFFKYENQQRTGSFKIRGAYNRISQLSAEQLKAGISACSAGNHAQGVALCAKLLGSQSYIVMPEVAPLAKVVATQGYGANVILKGSMFDEAYDHCMQISKENSYTLVHPYEDPEVVAGQGTIGLELLEQCAELDTVVVPIGGGGLISGIALALKTLKPQIKIIGAVPERVPAMKMLFDSKGDLPEKAPYKSTIADGIAVKKPSKMIYDTYISKYVDDIVSVSDDEIARAMVFLLERAKAVVEGSGAASLAAAKKASHELGDNVGIVISGGNVDLNLLASVIEKGLEHEGRLCRISVVVDDVPGMLNSLTQTIASHGANILEVTHRRLAQGIDIRQTEIEILLSTRNQEHVEKIKNALLAGGIFIKDIL